MAVTESMDFPRGLGRITAPDRTIPTSMAGALVIVDSFREERDQAIAERDDALAENLILRAKLMLLEGRLVAAQVAQYTAQAQARHR